MIHLEREKEYLDEWNPGFTFSIAHVLAHGKSDVSSFTPGCRPGVTDEPVLVIHVITNHDDGMVRLVSWASGIIKDTARVPLEGRVGKKTNDVRSIGGNGFGKGVDSGFVGVDEVVAGNAGFHHAVGV